MPNKRRILVAVDESEASRRAVAYVAEMIGGKPGIHVELFHLEEPPRMLEWGGAEDPAVEERVEAERAAAYEEMQQRRIARSRARLQPLESILSRHGIDVADLVVEFEEPLDRRNIADDILEAARERDCGTVVVGRDSFTGWQRLFRHHVAEDLVDEGKGLSIWVVE